MANQKAVEALQLLLQKLPNKEEAREVLANPSENTIYVEKAPYKQYPIPSEPSAATKVPAFKPLGPIDITSTYKLQMGPYSAVTETKLNNVRSVEKTKYSYRGPVQQVRVSQLPPHPMAPKAAPPPNPLITNPAIASAAAANAANSLQIPQAYAVNAQPPLNLYHTMTMKKIAHAPIRSAPQKMVYQPIEITKSIAYEI